MAPIKLEDHIKERLEDREIIPIKTAWERIATNLDTKASKKQSRKRFWFAVAASFVGGLFIASMFFKPSKEVYPNVEIVDNQEYSKSKKNDIVDSTKNNSYEEVINKNNPSKIIIGQQKNVDIALENTNENSLNKDEGLRTKNFTKKIVDHELKLPSIAHSKVSTAHHDTITEFKKNNLATIVTVEEELKTQVDIDEEIETLFTAAQQEIQREKRYAQRTNLIDADDLLLDAEASIGSESFKDKIFRTLKSGLEDVVEVVMDKNN